MHVQSMQNGTSMRQLGPDYDGLAVRTGWCHGTRYQAPKHPSHLLTWKGWWTGTGGGLVVVWWWSGGGLVGDEASSLPGVPCVPCLSRGSAASLRACKPVSL